MVQLCKQPNLRTMLRTSIFILVMVETACILTAESIEVVFLVVVAVGVGLLSISKVYASQIQVFYYESAAILNITVWFSTFSEALSEAQARARVDSLRSLEKEVTARKLVGEDESKKEATRSFP
jgi:high-affinity K+ transport system ATPase subunit B